MLYILTILCFIFAISRAFLIINESVTKDRIFSFILSICIICSTMYFAYFFTEKETFQTNIYNVISSQDTKKYFVIEYTATYKHKIPQNFRYILLFIPDIEDKTYTILDQDGNKLKDLCLKY